MIECFVTMTSELFFSSFKLLDDSGDFLFDYGFDSLVGDHFVFEGHGDAFDVCFEAILMLRVAVALAIFAHQCGLFAFVVWAE